MSNINCINKNRDSNFELLRIVAILMVLVLHISGEVGAGFDVSKEVFGATTFLNFIYGACISAVDIFLMLSGFFSVYSNKRILGKPITLILIGIFYNLSYYLLTVIVSNEININSLLMTLIPSSYYVNIFCAVYLISPFINQVLLSLSKANLNYLMVLSIILFCIWPTIANSTLNNFFDIPLTGIYPTGFSGSDRGFTLLNFTFCYIIGAYIKITDFKFWNSQKARIAFIMVILTMSCIIVSIIPDLRSTVFGIDSYDHVFVILIAVSFFMLFKNIKLGSNKFVNYLASSTFVVYLIHCKIVVVLQKMFEYLNISIYNTSSLLSFIISFFLFVLIVYISSVSVFILMTWVFTPVRNLWYRSKLYNKPTFIIESH